MSKHKYCMSRNAWFSAEDQKQILSHTEYVYDEDIYDLC